MIQTDDARGATLTRLVIWRETSSKGQRPHFLFPPPFQKKLLCTCKLALTRWPFRVTAVIVTNMATNVHTCVNELFEQTSESPNLGIQYLLAAHV